MLQCYERADPNHFREEERQEILDDVDFLESPQPTTTVAEALRRAAGEECDTMTKQDDPVRLLCLLDELKTSTAKRWVLDEYRTFAYTMSV